MFKPSGDLRRDYDRLSSEYMKQKDRILSYQEQIASLRNSNKTLEKALVKEKECRKEEAAQKDADKPFLIYRLFDTFPKKIPES